MKWSAWGIALCIMIALRTGPACAAGAKPVATLTIHIENVLPSGGVLRLGVYDRALYPDDDSTPLASADVPAVAGETTVILHDLPPGIYAIQTFQDINANGDMDTSWLGLPLEPFGFSQDATPFLSKPSFDKVKFILTEGDNIQIIHLQNLFKSSPVDRARDSVRARQRQ